MAICCPVPTGQRYAPLIVNISSQSCVKGVSHLSPFCLHVVPMFCSSGCEVVPSGVEWLPCGQDMCPVNAFDLASVQCKWLECLYILGCY